MPTTNIYTGSGLAARLPEQSGQSASRLADFIRQTEEFKYKAYKENEQEFLKNVSVDPVHFLSAANQTAQLKSLEEHNKKWAKRWQETNGNLPTEDKVSMIQEGNYLRSWQDQTLAQQQRYQQDLAESQRNPTRYDVEKMAARTKEYWDTGQYLYPTPPLKAKDFGLFLRSQTQKYNRDKFPYRSEIVGGQRINYTTNIKDADIPSFIEDNIFIDEQATEGLIDEFRADNSDYKWSLLRDTNKDGKITNEDVDKNVIVEWARNNPKYIEATRNIISSVPKNIKTETGRGFNTKLPVNETNNRNADYPLQSGIKIPIRDFGNIATTEEISLPDFVPIDIANKTPVELPIREVYQTDNSGKMILKELSPGQTLPLQMVGYSPTLDALIVKAKEDSGYEEGKDTILEGNQIIIPAEPYDEYLKSIFDIYRLGFKRQPTKTEIKTETSFSLPSGSRMMNESAGNEEKQTKWEANRRK